MALIPAVASTLTSRVPLNDPAEGSTLARPLKSVSAMLWLALRMSGMTGLLWQESPAAEFPVAEFSEERSTIFSNATLAPSTGLGGEEESVTRTTIGWNA